MHLPLSQGFCQCVRCRRLICRLPHVCTSALADRHATPGRACARSHPGRAAGGEGPPRNRSEAVTPMEGREALTAGGRGGRHVTGGWREWSRPLASWLCRWREGPPRRWREGRCWRLEEGEVVAPLEGGEFLRQQEGREKREGEKSEGNLRFWGLYTREGKGYPDGSFGLSLGRDIVEGGP